MTTKIPVWLDCDPGLDDAVAILYAAYHPNLDLIAVSSVHGNAPVEDCTGNALAMLTIYHKEEIPMYAGCALPLEKEPYYAPFIHGDNGLGGIEIPEIKIRPANAEGGEDAMIEAMYDACKKYAGELALVAIGPLTNVAKLFMKHPDAKKLVKCVCVMGGCVDVVAPNFPNGGSFNIFGDPKASNVVMHDEEVMDKVLMCTLDVTFTTLANKQVRERMLNAPHTTKIRQAVHDLVNFFAASYEENQGFTQGPPLHDPVCLHILLEYYGIKNVGMKTSKFEITTVEKGEFESKLLYKEREDGRGSAVVRAVDVPLFWDELLETMKPTDGLEQ